MGRGCLIRKVILPAASYRPLVTASYRSLVTASYRSYNLQ